MQIVPIYYHFLKLECVHCLYWVVIIISLLVSGESLAGDPAEDADADDPDRLQWCARLPPGFALA